MKFTLIGDIHCRLDNLSKVNTLFDIIEELDNPTILLGDQLDSKAIVRAECINLLYSRLNSSKLHFTVLIGNHELITPNASAHSLETLKSISNVTIIDYPQGRTFGNKRIQFFPYMKDLYAIRKELDHARNSNVDYVIGHFDTLGEDYGNGFLAEHGLNMQDYRDFKRVISGHFHKYAQNQNLLYLGTPFSHSFGETDQTKYIGIWDTETDNLELIQTPFPQHKTYTVDCDSEVNIQESWLIFELDMNNYNRIILTGKSENIAKYPRTQGIKYIEKPMQSDKLETLTETMTHEQQFVKWASEIKGYDNELINLGMDILRDVH